MPLPPCLTPPLRITSLFFPEPSGPSRHLNVTARSSRPTPGPNILPMTSPHPQLSWPLPGSPDLPLPFHVPHSPPQHFSYSTLSGISAPFRFQSLSGNSDSQIIPSSISSSSPSPFLTLPDTQSFNTFSPQSHQLPPISHTPC